MRTPPMKPGREKGSYLLGWDYTINPPRKGVRSRSYVLK
jgi:hypothetical protein